MLRWPRALAALRVDNFRRFFIGQATSTLGSAMSPIALTFAVIAHGSISDLGDILAANAAPIVLSLVVGGVVADRLGRRRMMIIADMVRFSAQAALAGWIFVGHVPLAGFIVLSACTGIGSGLFSPALTGLIPEVVPDDALPQANALVGLAASSGAIIGPALAGIIVASASPGWAIAADALSYLVSVYYLTTLRVMRSQQNTRVSFVKELQEGWREFSSRTWLWVVVVQFSICNVVITAPFYVVGAIIAKQSLGGSRAWGAVLACQGAGAVAGGLVMLRYRPARPLISASIVIYCWVLPLSALAFRLPVGVIAGGAMLGGASLSVFSTIWDTTLQRNVPASALSRVSAYDWLGSLVLLPVGDALVGPLAHSVGYRTTLVAAAAVLSAGVTAVICVPAIARIRA